MSAATVVPERRAREYESIYIMRATAGTKDAEKVLERVREVMDGRGGKLLEVDNWGRRKLAYNVEKASRGVFVYLRFVGFEDLVVELERNFRLLDEVLRFQTVLINPRVDLESYEIDPERLAFGELEASDDDEEPGLAQRLGLVERPKPEPREDTRGDARDDSPSDDSQGDDAQGDDAQASEGATAKASESDDTKSEDGEES